MCAPLAIDEAATLGSCAHRGSGGSLHGDRSCRRRLDATRVDSSAPCCRRSCSWSPSCSLSLLEASRRGPDSAIACAAEISVLILRGPAASRVLDDRMTLIDAARPALSRARARRNDRRRVGWRRNRCGDHRSWPARPIPRSPLSPAGTPPKLFQERFSVHAGRIDWSSQLADERAAADETSRYARATEVRVANDPLIRPALSRRWDQSCRTSDPVRDLVARVIANADLAAINRHCSSASAISNSEKRSAIERRTSVRLMVRAKTPCFVES